MIAALFAAALIYGVQPSSDLRFRAETNRVFVDVFVTLEGRPIEGLRVEDFEVYDDGVLQKDITLLPANNPLSVALVLDGSASVRGEKLARLQNAARVFLEHLAEEDEVSVLTFGTRYRLNQPLTLDHELASRAIDRLGGLGGTALLDTLFASLLYVEKGSGRPLVLLFSDGDDNASWLSTRELVKAAERSEAILFVVRAATGAGVSIDATESHPAVFVENAADKSGRALLEAVAGATGGQVISLPYTADLAAAFREVLDIMRRRYLLVYEPTDSSPGWHRLEVRLGRGIRANVRARAGYFLK